MSATYAFARPQTAVDVLLFTVRDFWDRPGERPRLEIALIRRDREPFKGKLALPGTVMRIEPDDSGAIDDTDLDAARRVSRTSSALRRRTLSSSTHGLRAMLIHAGRRL